MAAVDNAVSQDAICSYIWRDMDTDDRCVVCLLADVSSEAAWLRWRQMQGVERIALRAALKSIIVDHWENERRRFSEPLQETDNHHEAVPAGAGAAMGPPPQDAA